MEYNSETKKRKKGSKSSSSEVSSTIEMAKKLGIVKSKDKSKEEKHNNDILRLESLLDKKKSKKSKKKKKSKKSNKKIKKDKNSVVKLDSDDLTKLVELLLDNSNKELVQKIVKEKLCIDENENRSRDKKVQEFLDYVEDDSLKSSDENRANTPDSTENLNNTNENKQEESLIDDSELEALIQASRKEVEEEFARKKAQEEQKELARRRDEEEQRAKEAVTKDNLDKEGINSPKEDVSNLTQEQNSIEEVATSSSEIAELNSIISKNRVISENSKEDNQNLEHDELQKSQEFNQEGKIELEATREEASTQEAKESNEETSSENAELLAILEGVDSSDNKEEDSVKESKEVDSSELLSLMGANEGKEKEVVSNKKEDKKDNSIDNNTEELLSLMQEDDDKSLNKDAVNNAIVDDSSISTKEVFIGDSYNESLKYFEDEDEEIEKSKFAGASSKLKGFMKKKSIDSDEFDDGFDDEFDEPEVKSSKRKKIFSKSKPKVKNKSKSKDKASSRYKAFLGLRSSDNSENFDDENEEAKEATIKTKKVKKPILGSISSIFNKSKKKRVKKDIEDDLEDDYEEVLEEVEKIEPKKKRVIRKSKNLEIVDNSDDEDQLIEELIEREESESNDMLDLTSNLMLDGEPIKKSSKKSKEPKKKGVSVVTVDDLDDFTPSYESFDDEDDSYRGGSSFNNSFSSQESRAVSYDYEDVSIFGLFIKAILYPLIALLPMIALAWLNMQLKFNGQQKNFLDSLRNDTSNFLAQFNLSNNTLAYFAIGIIAILSIIFAIKMFKKVKAVINNARISATKKIQYTGSAKSASVVYINSALVLLVTFALLGATIYFINDSAGDAINFSQLSFSDLTNTLKNWFNNLFN